MNKQGNMYVGFSSNINPSIHKNHHLLNDNEKNSDSLSGRSAQFNDADDEYFAASVPNFHSTAKISVGKLMAGDDSPTAPSISSMQGVKINKRKLSLLEQANKSG